MNPSMVELIVDLVQDLEIFSGDGNYCLLVNFPLESMFITLTI